MTAVPEPEVRASAYLVSCLPEGHEIRSLMTAQVEYRGCGLWAVTNRSRSLGSDGSWSFGFDWSEGPDEPATEADMALFDKEQAEWLATHRFDEAAALRLAKKAARELTCAGRTVADLLAPQRCDVKFVDGSQCSKSAGHRSVKNQDLHTPDSESAVLAFLHTPALAALLTTGDQRRLLLDIRDLIADDDLARAWLIGMNPALGDESPLGAIADGRGDQAMAAAREFIQ